MKTIFENIKENRRLFPIILIIGFVPLISHMFLYDTNLSQFEWFPEVNSLEIDYFLGCKMIAIITIGIVMLGILFWMYRKKEKMRFENSWYFLAFYGVFVVMSALFSPYKYWVFRGTYSLLEPVWVVIAYLIICYYSYTVIASEKQVNFVFAIAGIGVLMVSLIAIFQSLGMDFFHTELGEKLLVSRKYWDSIDESNVFNGIVSSTLDNPNYFSAYYGMVIPVSLGFIFGAKKLWGRVFAFFIFLISCYCLWCSHSSSGVLALGISSVIIGFVLTSRTRLGRIIYGLLIMILVFGGAIILVSTETGYAVSESLFGTYKYQDESYLIKEIDTRDDCIRIKIRDDEINLSYEYGNTPDEIRIICWDGDGNEIPYHMSEADLSSVYIDDERFPGGIVSIGQTNGMNSVKFFFEYREIIFTKEIDGTYYYLNPANKFVKTTPVKRVNLFNEDAMSGRGTIWNKVIPLLPKHILMGCGANAFLLEYPQTDYIYLFRIDCGGLVDVKAHSWYLQQMIENGILGTSFLLVFLVWYLVDFIIVFKRVETIDSMLILGTGIADAVLVYLIVSIVNDSMVCTSPIFWAVLGIGMAQNHLLKGTIVESPVEVNEAIASDVVKTPARKKQSRKQRKDKK